MQAYSLVFIASLFVVNYAGTSVRRWKREFMFVPGNDTTKADCYQKCNDEWNVDFQQQFNIVPQQFYDFPLHSAILNNDGYAKYCQLQKQRLRCYRSCGDESPEQAWSPANHLCIFERQSFVDNIDCLEKSAKAAFQSCDSKCHQQADLEVRDNPAANVGTVFNDVSSLNYRQELTYLCTFQQCYDTCQKETVQTSCDPTSANGVIGFYGAYVANHAEDVFYWLTSNNKADLFPVACIRLMPQLTPVAPTNATVIGDKGAVPLQQLLLQGLPLPQRRLRVVPKEFLEDVDNNNVQGSGQRDDAAQILNNN